MIAKTDVKLNGYYMLLKNLEVSDKIKLISEISNSILKDEMKTETDFFSCFGKYESEKTAEEIIEELRKDL